MTPRMLRSLRSEKSKECESLMNENLKKQGTTKEESGVDSAPSFLASFRREETKCFFLYILSFVVLVVVLIVSFSWLVTLPGIVCLCWMIKGTFEFVSAETATSGMEQTLLLPNEPDIVSAFVVFLVVVYVIVDVAFEMPRFFDKAPFPGKGLARIRTTLLWTTTLIFVLSLILGIAVNMLQQVFVDYGDEWLNAEGHPAVPAVLFLIGGLFCSILGMLGVVWLTRRGKSTEMTLSKNTKLGGSIFSSFRSTALFLKSKTADNGLARWLILVTSIGFTGIAIPLAIVSFIAAAFFAFAIMFCVFLLLFAFSVARRQ